MIHGLRLKALGMAGYVFFIVFLLPILIAGLYYIIFRCLLWQSKKEQAI